MLMNKRIILTASFFGGLAIVFGAFAPHVLRERISAGDVEIWKTAVNYQVYHALALLFLSSFSRFRSRLINVASYAFTLGIVFFSGSLYIMSTRSLTGIEWNPILGPITPIGGLLFIIGWICLFLAALKNK